jgi:hypothetical protein
MEDIAVTTTEIKNKKLKYFPLRAFLSHTHFHYRYCLLFILQTRDITHRKDMELKR